ncbi:MAG: hypothetical protein JEZ08_21230 [Clostridiales bacterium]|nr:hypothetical protein [Clostridiales bacterium]
MSIHQYNPNKRADSDYIEGSISYLQKGNKCRLLDGRRTPGFIENIDYESGMFKWRITDFEDKDNHWDVPFEKVTSYQFDNICTPLSTEETKRIQTIITELDQPLTILSSEESYQITERKIEELKLEAVVWLNSNSTFLASEEILDFSSNIGSERLANDLIQYMRQHKLEELESKTADYIVLNPNSGEWIKGMSIMLAEMGIVSFVGKGIRTKDIFTGIGTKSLRKAYLLHRLAFLRAVFSILNIKHIPLYRGMCSEVEWRKSNNTLMSFTFNNSVAKSFSGFDGDDRFRNAYFLKATVPMSKIFMTYLETHQMNERYKEAEALLFNTLNITI